MSVEFRRISDSIIVRLTGRAARIWLLSVTVVLEGVATAAGLLGVGMLVFRRGAWWQAVGLIAGSFVLSSWLILWLLPRARAARR